MGYKRKTERSKYGPNINIKIFKVVSEKEIDISKFSNYLIGPKKQIITLNMS